MFKFISYIKFRHFTLQIILCILLVSIHVEAQYSEEWSVDQPYYEVGVLNFDYNHDGSIEITKFYLNTVTVYNGADNFNVL